MDIIQGPVTIEPATNRSESQSQPVVFDASVNDASIRQAIVNAEANNQDPLTLTSQDLAQVSVPVAPKATEVPQKFLKPDGAVDVEKIQASTKQLDEAIAKKEEAVTKTVDDYLREYQERETKFRTMPNPEKLAANLPPPISNVPPQANMPVAPQNYEDVVRRDFQQDPLMTTTRLIEIALEQKFAPVAQRERLESVRTNVSELAAKDPRILRQDVFDAIKAKIANDPDIASRKNPYKAAWLEVKEEMRLGEPLQVQTQPRLSPVLGGGTPPSTPSASVPSSPQTIASSLSSLDLRDKKQEAIGDAAIRKLLEGSRG